MQLLISLLLECARLLLNPRVRLPVQWVNCTGIPIVSNGAYQGEPEKLCVKFRVHGFSFDCKEVFIRLLRHVGRAGVGVNLKATCSCQKAARQLCWRPGCHYPWRKLPYSRKYWRELNLAVEPNFAITRILVDLNLAVRYGIGIRIHANRKFWWILIWRL